MSQLKQFIEEMPVEFEEELESGVRVKHTFKNLLDMEKAGMDVFNYMHSLLSIAYGE